jgi:hypothetical protein
MDTTSAAEHAKLAANARKFVDDDIIRFSLGLNVSWQSKASTARN